ncbi:carbon-nitrogen hydrolase family protein [Antarcticibacterium arcticum]|uniref:Carbon-nitrogen hydrolase family protein n=1 Tax=Antarcticibacterium arcticum TaxID=2585771 RepID=A0A5B8YJ97_9FLAO|nr:carbon-nitrogen hydrolase family protein [Antarcticibacterium arcticum]QED37711.1 carbon-nitrogen hydrolase family protein [Antarcticibacterium arcticum]
MKNLILGLFLFGLTTQLSAQIIELPEIEIVGVNYKYLAAAGESDAPIPVKMLQRQAAVYDIKAAEFYDDEYDNYSISFFIPEGRILASYDKDGNVLRTIEKYKNLDLPPAVSQAISKNYNGWTMTKNAYLVNYHDRKGVTKKEYKILLEKDNQRMRVKTDENGVIIKS